MQIIAVLSLALIVAVASASAEVFTGNATTYGLDDAIGGACSVRRAPSGVTAGLFVAMNKQQYGDSSACSRCISLTGPSATVTTYVADLCSECGHGNLDLNTALWNKVVGGDPRIEDISWSFVACPKDDVAFCLKEGSNSYWLALQVTNSANGIDAIEIAGQDASVIGITSFYQLSPSTPVDMDSLAVTITSTSGETSSYTVSSDDYSGCESPAASSDTSTPSATTTTTTTTVTVGVEQETAWRSYRRRRTKLY